MVPNWFVSSQKHLKRDAKIHLVMQFFPKNVYQYYVKAHKTRGSRGSIKKYPLTISSAKTLILSLRNRPWSSLLFWTSPYPLLRLILCNIMFLTLRCVSSTAQVTGYFGNSLSSVTNIGRTFLIKSITFALLFEMFTHCHVAMHFYR